MGHLTYIVRIAAKQKFNINATRLPSKNICLEPETFYLWSFDKQPQYFAFDFIGPVCVVSIAGPYRKGKSWVLSQAFNQPEVFPLGHEMVAETMGIWLWIVPEKYKVGKRPTSELPFASVSKRVFVRNY